MPIVNIGKDGVNAMRPQLELIPLYQRTRIKEILPHAKPLQLSERERVRVTVESAAREDWLDHDALQWARQVPSTLDRMANADRMTDITADKV